MGEYAPSPEWVPTTPGRHPQVALVMFGRVEEPPPTDAPAWANEQPEES